ncbi:hypothetical protein [Prauserella flavalba]|uniref:hypothetical protein n=1 Tax=Prauserella flavalba TaxID=1477506 RepID=UPI0036E9CDEC
MRGERVTARLRLRAVTMAGLDAFVVLEAALRARADPPREPPAPAESARYLAAFTRVWERGDLGDEYAVPCSNPSAVKATMPAFNAVKVAFTAAPRTDERLPAAMSGPAA